MSYKKSGKPSGQMIQAFYSAFEQLLIAEGDQRRVRIELRKPEPEEQSAPVLAIADCKKVFGLSQGVRPRRDVRGCARRGQRSLVAASLHFIAHCAKRANGRDHLL
ncbi:hypothetical protein GCM10010415_04290 [Streptomyces atrovirens]|uniref:Uncharacterized protein n=1 Tax=Streptomyces atrovirens TaxID=285556 RepID=A0ABW0E2I6_9ACTN